MKYTIQSRKGNFLDTSYSTINGVPCLEFKTPAYGGLNWDSDPKKEDYQDRLISDLIGKHKEWLDIEISETRITLSVKKVIPVNEMLPKPQRRGFSNTDAEILQAVMEKIAVKLAGDFPVSYWIKKLNSPQATEYTPSRMIQKAFK